MSVKHKARVGISIGDYNGIGPEIVLKTFVDKMMLDFCTPVIFAPVKILERQKRLQKINQNYFAVKSADQARGNRINLVDLGEADAELTPGEPTVESREVAQASLSAGVKAVSQGHIDLLVVASADLPEDISVELPVGKPAKKDRFLEPVELVLSSQVRMGVFPDHTFEDQDKSRGILKKQLKAFNRTLQQDFWIEKPKIAVLGVKAYNGGDEKLKIEDKITEEVCISLFDEGFLTFGPFTKEEFFTAGQYRAYDILLTPNRLTALELVQKLSLDPCFRFFGGLSRVVTAPVHGDCFDVAGKNAARTDSFTEALFSGLKIYQDRTEHLELEENQLEPAVLREPEKNGKRDTLDYLSD